MAGVRKCYHECHGPLAELYGVDVNDVVEAEAACDACKDEHPPRRAYAPPEKWTPNKDTQADGLGDGN